jgi:hypothetical protein
MGRYLPNKKLKKSSKVLKVLGNFICGQWEQKWRDPLRNVLVPKYNSFPCTIGIIIGGIQDRTDFAKTTLNPKPKPVTK